MNNETIVCGIGPGSEQLILPAVFEAAEKATVIVGGKRQQTLFDTTGKHCIFIGSNIEAVIQELSQCQNERIVVLVSGDTGYYSFLRTLKRHLPNWPVQAIPGISSFQYMFAKLGLSYEQAYLGSAHGNHVDIASLPDIFSSYFFLTDKKMDYRKIASTFNSLERGQWMMHVGNRLSYPDESIWSDKVANFINKEPELELCSVIIQKPKSWP